ncbi:MAG TPA: Stp1/IreP family PP2C-type Ser/Thr phosphatase [Roseiflexaceae bacterium]|nr:Stp1/IreP family PP2C-type Ser/Thr phosphatase [Roseiflexaceae bacterium]
MTAATCPFCGAPTKPGARFCPACGRPLTPATAPVEGMLPNRRLRVEGESMQLRDLINVVESGVQWWQTSLSSADSVTRAHAATAIEELSRVLHSLSQQLALGRETVRITTRLPVLREYVVGCPICGRGNREGARFCQGCGAQLPGPASQTGATPPMPLRFTIAMRSDTGRVRRNNQDSVYSGTVPLGDGREAYLCLVADGMGGANAGEQASQIAAEVTQAYVRRGLGARQPPDDSAWENLLRSAARAANQRVYEESRSSNDRHGMGTTLTVALIVGDRIHIAQVGDSRAYLINAAGVTADGATSAQLTSDHSLVARLVDIGQITPEQARTHPQRNLLYRSIGTDPSVEVDTRSEQLKAGDLVLLCSDGLINTVRDEEMARIATDQPDPERACEQLVALANERGGSDNISVVIVRVESTPA